MEATAGYKRSLLTSHDHELNPFNHDTTQESGAADFRVLVAPVLFAATAFFLAGPPPTVLYTGVMVTVATPPDKPLNFLIAPTGNSAASAVSAALLAADCAGVRGGLLAAAGFAAAGFAAGGLAAAGGLGVAGLGCEPGGALGPPPCGLTSCMVPLTGS